jgi:hypothetical protein
MGAGGGSPFGRMSQEVRNLTNDVRALVGQMSQLGRATGAGTGGSVAQQHIAGMRQLLSLQQQALANNNRLVAGPGGGAVADSIPTPRSRTGRSTAP